MLYIQNKIVRIMAVLHKSKACHKGIIDTVIGCAPLGRI